MPVTWKKHRYQLINAPKDIDEYGKALKAPEQIDTESLLQGAVIGKAVDLATNAVGTIAGKAKEAAEYAVNVGKALLRPASSEVAAISGAAGYPAGSTNGKSEGTRKLHRNFPPRKRRPH